MFVGLAVVCEHDKALDKRLLFLGGVSLEALERYAKAVYLVEEKHPELR